MSMDMVQVCYGKCTCTKVVRVRCSIIEATTITGVPFQMPILKVACLRWTFLLWARKISWVLYLHCRQLVTLLYTIHDSNQLSLLVRGSSVNGSHWKHHRWLQQRRVTSPSVCVLFTPLTYAVCTNIWVWLVVVTVKTRGTYLLAQSLNSLHLFTAFHLTSMYFSKLNPFTAQSCTHTWGRTFSYWHEMTLQSFCVGHMQLRAF